MALIDTIALCTLADVKDDLGITDSASDARLERRILSASEAIGLFLARPLRREVGRVEKLPGYGTPYLFPRLTPVESIASIIFNGVTFDAGTYKVRDDVLIYRADGWRSTALGVQTTAAELQRLPGTEDNLYEVTFTGGYYLPNDTAKVGTALPYGITEAAIALVVTWHLNRGRNLNVQAEAVGEASIQMASAVGGVDAIPNFVRSMLAPFKRAV